MLSFFIFFCASQHFVFRFVANRFLLAPEVRAAGQSVEWQYSFDVHCNAFFPVFIVLYVIQFFLTPALVLPGRLAAICSSTMYAAALSYYHYITFLGYSGAHLYSLARCFVLTVGCVCVAEIRMLRNIIVFLYPIAGILFIYLIALLSGWNPSVFVLGTVYFP